MEHVEYMKMIRHIHLYTYTLDQIAVFFANVYHLLNECANKENKTFLEKIQYFLVGNTKLKYSFLSPLGPKKMRSKIQNSLSKKVRFFLRPLKWVEGLIIFSIICMYPNYGQIHSSGCWFLWYDWVKAQWTNIICVCCVHCTKIEVLKSVSVLVLHVCVSLECCCWSWWWWCWHEA